MIYLDYAANYPAEKEVLETFVNAHETYLANPNSNHDLGKKAEEAINKSTQHMKELLKLHNKTLIYTSGASEANNLAIKGICEKYEKGIYISTKSACSKTDTPSKAVLAVTNDSKKASSSVRISVSKHTTDLEVQQFIEVLKEIVL